MMKFHNGCWLLKEGYGSFSPQQAYEIRKQEYEVQICAPTRHIAKKGDTLDGVNLTVRITAPMPEVLQIKTYHYAGVNEAHDVAFDLNLPEGSFLEAEEDGDYVRIKSGTLTLTVDKRDCSMRY